MLAVKLVILVRLKWSGTGTMARLWHDAKITGPRQGVKNKVVFSTAATWDRLQSANDCGVASRREEDFQVVIIIIMYSYYALSDGLSVYMMHINLNTLFYIHLEHPTETICIKYYMKGEKTRNEFKHLWHWSLENSQHFCAVVINICRILTRLCILQFIYSNKIQIQNTVLSVAIIAIKRKCFFFVHTSSATLNNVVKLI